MSHAALSLLSICGLALLAGCGGFGTARTCYYNGTTYNSGDSFRSIDGCNTCSCSSAGLVACTTIACGTGQCLYDGKTYNPGDSFPSADGCNTCQCDASGGVGCTKKLCPTPAATTWLSLDPVQCGGNPWQKVTSKGDGTAPSYPDPELLSIDNYFEDQGIDLLDLGLLYPSRGGSVCTACSCGRGDTLLIHAKTTDVTKLKTYGFAEILPSEGYGYVSRQCTNQWPSAGTIASKDEAMSAATWLSSKGASVSGTGFVFHTTSVASCLACGCPRGDTLATFPKDAASVTVVTGLSFSLLAR